MRIAAVLFGMIMCSTLLFGDDQSIDLDHQFDFSKIKTFTIRDGIIVSTRPELNNAMVRMKIREAIRTSLVFKGLKESSDRPNVTLEFTVSHSDPAEFINGKLVIDMTASEPGTLIWRGTYRDDEKNSTRFAEQLPGDARKLLEEFPPKKEK